LSKTLLLVCIQFAVWNVSALAQNIGGHWQGTLRGDSRDLRIVVEIKKENDGGWKALLHSIDQITEVIAADSVTLNGSWLRLSAESIGSSFQGRLNPGGTVMTGQWSGKEPDFLGTKGNTVPLELRRASKKNAWRVDPTAHTTKFITVQAGVTLEVLDWGGQGRNLVLIPGSGNTAHIFDPFATKLALSYHVYGITRRGFGASSVPPPTPANYAADRLGDDVLAVIHALGLVKPVLAGHSLGGEELSSVGSRQPDQVAGLIYLEAAYHWAYYDSAHSDLIANRNEVIRKLQQLRVGQPLPGLLIRDLLDALPALEKDLREEQQKLNGALAAAPESLPMTVGWALQFGMQKYTNIPVPVLAIYAIPHDRGIADPAAAAAADAKDMETSGVPAKAFQAGVPSARVVILPHADHYIYTSNEADVLREMKAFISSLP
jgi:pimeloyl-ACP methyl ester carboxylesterase